MKEKKLLCLMLTLALLTGSAVPAALAEPMDEPAANSTAASALSETEAQPITDDGPAAEPTAAAETAQDPEPSPEADEGAGAFAGEATAQPTAADGSAAEPSAKPTAAPDTASSPEASPQTDGGAAGSSDAASEPKVTFEPTVTPTPVPEAAAEPDDGSAKTEEPIDTPPSARQTAHAAGCSDDCTDESCTCSCHRPGQPGFFEQLLLCTTLEQADVLMAQMGDAAWDGLTADQLVQVEAHLCALEPAPLPAVVPENTAGTAVPSEIVHPTVSFVQAAPLGRPVTGTAQKGDSQ